MNYALLLSVFVIASCGLAYELISGALSSYLLGDSITQFSTVIGTYLFAMGIGSWLSKYIEKQLIKRFIQIELMIGILGGFSAALLFILFAYAAAPFRVVLYSAIAMIGILVGLEIPLVMRILKDHLPFKELVSHVLTVDYLGALSIAVLFPLWLVPHLGLIRSGLLFGLMNVIVAIWALWLFRHDIIPSHSLRLQSAIVLLLVSGGFGYAETITRFSEHSLYSDEILLARTTPYQRIVVTRWRDHIRLFLNGNLQFSSFDEYRYHEALIHPGLQALPWAKRVLLLGGGDGLAVREILKYPQIESITLVDLDPAMTQLFSTVPVLRTLNQDSLLSPKLHIINSDAFKWLEETRDTYDFIVVDFPDPSNFNIGKLYSNVFYQMLERHLSARGATVIQATSPLYARHAYWCIVTTLEQSGLMTYPYHALVPSFGEWGYVLATRGEYHPPQHYQVPTRFLANDSTPTLFQFPPDMARLSVEPNQLTTQVLVRYFDQDWNKVLHHAP